MSVIISLRAAAGLDGLQERGKIVGLRRAGFQPGHPQSRRRHDCTATGKELGTYYLVTNEGTDPEMLKALGLKVSLFVGIMGDKVRGGKRPSVV